MDHLRRLQERAARVGLIEMTWHGVWAALERRGQGPMGARVAQTGSELAECLRCCPIGCVSLPEEYVRWACSSTTAFTNALTAAADYFSGVTLGSYAARILQRVHQVTNRIVFDLPRDQPGLFSEEAPDADKGGTGRQPH